MESLQETPLIKFNPNTLGEVRRELNLDHSADIEEMLKQFEEWILKQQHFTKTDFSRHYLETSIISAKGSLERAKKTLDKLCTLKTLLPSFFSKHDLKNEFHYRKFIIQATMPKLLKDNYRVFILRIFNSDFDPALLLDVYRFSVLEGYGWRVKAIHVLSPSKSVDAIVTILKQVVSAKIGNRIKVHKTAESLYEHVPKEVLPVEYGGDEKSLNDISENWVNVLSAAENVAYFKEICQAGTDEKYRLTATYNDQILGMPGSFRSLVVD